MIPEETKKLLKSLPVKKTQALSYVMELLQRRVGSPLSFTSIAKDVGVTSRTVSRYLKILEQKNIVFMIYPYFLEQRQIFYKNPKIYFYENFFKASNEGVYFENKIALKLKKHLEFLNKNKKKDYQLSYLKNKTRKEIDFCLLDNSKIKYVIETKISAKIINPTLLNLSQLKELKAIQVIKKSEKELNFSKENISLITEGKLLSILNL